MSCTTAVDDMLLHNNNTGVVYWELSSVSRYSPMHQTCFNSQVKIDPIKYMVYSYFFQ